MDEHTVTQPKPHRGRRIAKFVLLGLLALCAIGAVLERLAVRGDLARFEPLGEIYTVSGKPMHLYCTGEPDPKGGTVILEAATGDSLYTWYGLQPEISTFARVCSYDRAGYGWSEPQPGARTADAMAGELHELLAAAGVQEPYLIVGHSVGGLPARYFASVYPTEVSGLVLIDIVPVESLMSRPVWLRYSWGMLPGVLTGFGGLIAEVGVVRALSDLVDLYLSDALLYLPPQVVPEARAQYVRAGRLLTSANEQIYIPRSAAMVFNASLPEDLPVVSLIASHDLQEQRLAELEQDFAGLTANSWVVNVDSGHYIHLEKPDVVLEVIRELLAAR